MKFLLFYPLKFCIIYSAHGVWSAPYNGSIYDAVNKMKLFLDFFRQEVPKNTRNPLFYYRQSVRLADRMLAVYFIISLLLVFLTVKQFFWLPTLLLGLLLIKLFHSDQLSARVNLLLVTLLVCAWSCWYVVLFGWDFGGQHMLFVLIVLVFFCLYEPPTFKIIYFLLILTVRISLFQYTSAHEPLVPMDSFTQFLMQMVNTISSFLMLAGCCIVYSSNLQETARQLLLHNQQLQVQAETDPLTKLINRRGFMDVMTRYISDNPEAMYCVAIADIDFFKRVNDTYGHNCGDYVLQQLSKLFTEQAKEGYFVSRWGGEEFCFFFPGMNIDDASRIMTDLLIAVRKMQIEYEDHRFSITITAGVEENDYRSPLADLLESADRKLYRGKANGRNQMVF